MGVLTAQGRRQRLRALESYASIGDTGLLEGIRGLLPPEVSNGRSRKADVLEVVVLCSLSALIRSCAGDMEDIRRR